MELDNYKSGLGQGSRIDYINELDSYFIKKYLRQDLQDLQDVFSFIPPSYLKKLVVADKQETGNVKVKSC